MPGLRTAGRMTGHWPHAGAWQLGAHLVGGSQLDEDSGLLVPDHDDTRAGLHHQVLAHLPSGVGCMVAFLQLDHLAVLVLQLQLRPLQEETSVTGPV